MNTIKAILKKIFFDGSFHSYYPAYLRKRINAYHRLPILNLHRISPHKEIWPPLPPHVFSELLAYLIKYFNIITFQELKTYQGKKPPLILSFDDGYYDFIEYAMPILRKFNLKVNHNIIPSQLNNEEALWNNQLYDFLKTAPLKEMKRLDHPMLAIKDCLKKDLTKVDIALLLSAKLKNIKFKSRMLILKDWQENCFNLFEPYPKTRMIKLKEMSVLFSEHEVGVHSYAHHSMQQESLSFFIEDYLKCEDFFKKNHLPNFNIYAFPNGSYREEHIQYLISKNIEHILLVNNQLSTKKSPYPRISIAATHASEAILQSLGMHAHDS